MNEAQCLCVQRLTRTKLEAVAHELAILAEISSLENLVTAIYIVIEKNVTDMFHVYPDLVCASGFKITLYQGDITEPLKHTVVCNCMLTDRIVG